MTQTTKIKICGNTNAADIKLARELGADFLGFIFTKSKRRIDPERAEALIAEMPDFENYVGVFANQPKQEVERISKSLKLRWLQFHGEETSRYCDHFMDKGYFVIKSFHVKDVLSLKRLDQYNVSAFLFDTYSKEEKGGTGKAFDWSIIKDLPYVHDRLFLAGGLTIHNVKQAIELVKPYAIDVASGVEKNPGVKDTKLLQEFIRLAKEQSEIGTQR